MNEKAIKSRSAVLEVEHISKSFGEVQALQDVSFRLYENEILGLVGSNGAGKSTLIKIISGLFPPTSGRLILEGTPVRFSNPHEARIYGISTVHQKMEETLAPNHDIVANVFMGEEIYRSLFGRAFNWVKVLDKQTMERETTAVLNKININISSIHRPIVSYSGGQRQAVAIGKAIRRNPKILILDEPTAALGVKETRQVLHLIRELRQRKISIIVIGHDLEEIFEVADRIVVLRNGQKVGDCLVKDVEKQDIVSLIVGAQNLDATE